MQKLMFAIVQHDDASAVTHTLATRGYRTTRYASHGGFLHRGNDTFLIAIDEEQIDDVVRLIRETCHPRMEPLTALPGRVPAELVALFGTEVPVGSAIIFVAPLVRMVRV